MPRLVVEQRDALAVDRDVDVFERACRRRRRDVDRGTTYSPSAGKMCIDDDAAARAVRRALDVIPRVLRRERRRVVASIDRRRRLAIADRRCG